MYIKIHYVLIMRDGIPQQFELSVVFTFSMTFIRKGRTDGSQREAYVYGTPTGKPPFTELHFFCLVAGSRILKLTM